MSNVPAEPQPLRPAATLILLRDAGGGPQVLMAERGSGMAFAGGALVFPGGAVDVGDVAHGQAVAPGLDSEDAAARVAAARETLEESGLAVALGGGVERSAIRALREGLARGGDFGQLLVRAGLSLDPHQLEPFSRWSPPLHAARRFDTRFYVTTFEGDDTDATPDGLETARLVWARPGDLLAAARRDEAKVIFPTRCNLERLAQFDSASAILAHARSQPLATVSPWIETRDGKEYLCIPEGIGYPRTAEPVATALRG